MLTTAQAAIAAAMTEDELMEKIREQVDQLGLLAHHDNDSRRSWGPGFPDLVVAGPRGTLFREVKNQRNALSADQRRWGVILTQGGSRWGTWRPSDLLSGRIAYELTDIA